MIETVIHPKSALRALGTALDRIIEEEPEAIGAPVLVDRVLTDNPTWETGSEQLRRQAKDLLRARFDFGALRDEAAAIEAMNPSAMTHKEIERAANRLREIGETFEAAANALEAETNALEAAADDRQP